MKWDLRFLRLAKEVSTWSKDPSTQVGAVIVKGKHIISTGYNGFPTKINDNTERLCNRDIKLKLTIHAEMNAILQANQYNIDGATLYVYGLPPCIECAKHIAATNISKVIYSYSDRKDKNDQWFETVDFIDKMFNEANIEFDFLSLDNE